MHAIVQFRVIPAFDFDVRHPDAGDASAAQDAHVFLGNRFRGFAQKIDGEGPLVVAHLQIIEAVEVPFYCELSHAAVRPGKLSWFRS